LLATLSWRDMRTVRFVYAALIAAAKCSTWWASSSNYEHP